MTWVLITTDGRVLASGSWQEVIEAGEHALVIGRRWSRCDDSEACPVKLAPFVIVAPRGMFPEAEESLRYG